MTYFPRSKDAKQKLVGLSVDPIRTVTLACGHEATRGPLLSGWLLDDLLTGGRDRDKKRGRAKSKLRVPKLVKLPVKTSTRERMIQVWAHQRVLDGVYGAGRFLGTPVILAETKTDVQRRSVTEICLPDQWRLYQMHIAQLRRVYYLDVPAAYEPLGGMFPPINVMPFGQFFFEADQLGAA